MEDDKRSTCSLPNSAKEQQIRLEEAKKARIEAETKKKKQQMREDDKKRRRSSYTKLPKKIRIAIPIVAVVFIIVFAGVIVPLVLDDDETQYITETSLKEAVNVENLAAIDYTYKGIAESTGQFLWMDTVDYRVKYEAHVRANYKMSEIEFTMDETNRMIIAYLPEAEIGSPVLDETKFGYLPERAMADMKDVLALCKEDAARDLDIDEMRIEASRSLQNIIIALTMPLLGDDWSLEFKSLSEYPNVAVQEVQDEAK